MNAVQHKGPWGSLEKIKSTISNPMKILIYISLLFIKLQVFPSANLLVYLGFAVALDFFTGVIKAVVLKQARTSNGFRKTVTKFLQYGGTLVVGVILANVAKENNWGASSTLNFFNDALIVFMIYIEATSVFENMYACDSKSTFSKMVIVPIYKILTAQISKGFFSTPPMDTKEGEQNSINQNSIP
jgi:phage-related holin